MEAFQDHYPENVAHCYGCGRLNQHGHQIKTFWEGEEAVTHFFPEPYHTSVPAMYRAEERDLNSLPALRFVTGSLHVDFLKPTPIDGPLELRGRISEIKGRKVVVETEVFAAGVVTARGKVVAVQMPDDFGAAPPH